MSTSLQEVQGRAVFLAGLIIFWLRGLGAGAMLMVAAFMADKGEWTVVALALVAFAAGCLNHWLLAQREADGEMT